MNIRIFNFLTCLIVLLLFNSEINAQDYFGSRCEDQSCDASFTAGTPNWPDVGEIEFDPVTGMPINANDLEITSFLVEPNGFTNYAYFITGPVENEIRPIVGVTYDGTWDFKGEVGQVVEEGEYCLTGLAYNQEDLDAYLNNIIIEAILCQCSPDENCGEGVDSLHQLVNLLNEKVNSICEVQTVYTIDTMLCLFRDLFPIAIGYEPCMLTTEESFCFEVSEGETQSCGGLSAGIPNWPNVDTVYYDEFDGIPINNYEIEITSFQEEPVGFDDYGYLITGPLENGINPIVGFTNNGLWDLQDIGGNIMPEGEYCFTGFGYDADDVIAVGNNFIASTLFCQCFEDNNCPFNDPYTLEGLIDTYNATDSLICDENTKINIDSFLNNYLKNLPIIIGYDPCASITEESFCFQLTEINNPVTEIIVNDDAIIIGTDTIYIGEEYLFMVQGGI